MYQFVVKRILGMVIAVICLPVFAIIFIIVAPLIYLEDRGPVFYSGKRIGKNSKLYKMYKFRSMRVNSPDIRFKDGSTYNGKDDPRVTKIGYILRETSLDETPQILNILKGDMSLIGPRPDPPDWLDKYPKNLRSFLNVRPGITGYSQAYYRNADNSYEKIVHDCYYAEHVSLKFDIKIFLKTILTVFKHENLYRENNQKLFDEMCNSRNCSDKNN